MFRIVVVGWKAEQYIERCLTSIKYQTVQDWTACVVLDPSEDRTVELAKRFSIIDPRIKVIANNRQVYAISNIICSIMEQYPENEDIIVTVDSDDWMSRPDALEIVKRYYDNNSELLMTHGSWVSYPDSSVQTNNCPYTEADWSVGIRKVAWRASHLRTFKYRVFKHVNYNDLRGPGGEYAKVAGDLALTFPMLELSGAKRVMSS